MKLAEIISKAKTALAADKQKKAHCDRKALAFAAMLGVCFLAMAPDMALAAPWDDAATKVLEIFTSGLARTLATIAIIACGIAAMAGKLSWDWAIKIIIGIVLVFGAPTIVSYFA